MKTKKRSYRKYKGGDNCEKTYGNHVNEMCICKDENGRVIHKWIKQFDHNEKANYWFDNENKKATWIPPCN